MSQFPDLVHIILQEPILLVLRESQSWLDALEKIHVEVASDILLLLHFATIAQSDNYDFFQVSWEYSRIRKEIAMKNKWHGNSSSLT